MKRVEKKDDTGRRYVLYDLNKREITNIVTSYLVGKEDYAVAAGSTNWIIQDNELYGLQFNVTLD